MIEQPTTNATTSSTISVKDILGIGFRPASVFSGLTPGVTVVSVAPGSPAAKAGLTPGDIVTDSDGTPVNSADALLALLLTKQPGTKISLAWTDVLGTSHGTTIAVASGPPQ